jgi:gas vesicle structural protein
MIRGATSEDEGIPAGASASVPRPPSPALAAADEDTLAREVTLLELLDRVLDKGVVLSGDITLSVADVDLVYVGLRVLLSSVDAAERARCRSESESRVPRQGEGPAETGRPPR